MVALPDAPLVAAWTWALCFLADAFLDGRERAWLPAGLFAGLAFDSKYTAAFLFLGAGVLLLLLPRGRRALGTPWPWLGLLAAGLATAPVWIWNAQHDWASFLYQTAGRVEHARGLSPWNLLGLLASQAVLVLPPLLWVWGREAVHAVPRMLRGALPPEELFLAAFSFVPALVLLAVSLGAVVKPNWPLPLWVAGALWAARRSGPWLLRWNVVASALVHAVVLVELFAYPVRLGDDTWVGWRSLREQTRARLGPGEFAFSADDYKTTAELLLDGTVEAYGRNLLGQPALQFDLVGLDVGALRGADRPVPRLRPPEVRRRAIRAATGGTRSPVRTDCRRSHRWWSGVASASSGASVPGAASATGRPRALQASRPRSRRGCSATRPVPGAGRWRP